MRPPQPPTGVVSIAGSQSSWSTNPTSAELPNTVAPKTSHGRRRQPPRPGGGPPLPHGCARRILPSLVDRNGSRLPARTSYDRTSRGCWSGACREADLIEDLQVERAGAQVIVKVSMGQPVLTPPSRSCGSTGRAWRVSCGS